MTNHKSIRGGCLCGCVQYEISGPLKCADHCHCSMCRRQHGAAFATYASFESDDFRFTLGADRIKIFEVSVGGGGWCFCVECGSTVAGTENGEITSVTLGTVEGDPVIRPQSHIFAGSKACWYDIQDNLQQFDQWPQSG